ncbi:hypothetical protein [Kineosporia succinea]|uniref:Uncharacterized protein n=1 Tax=Kineosporia succinea TaxID=84632 RepID=A0ABT9PE55_9ACTN|nr:hypothetical protein [Kineosporia succinea]MDP9830982.1 hypothetical protein [Kineosporia succinea]
MPPLSDWCFPQRLGVVDEAGELSGARIAADTGSLLELLQGLGMRPAIARTATEAFRSAAQELTHSEPGARVARYEDLRRRTSSWITTAIEFGTWGHDADTSRYYETLFDQRSDPGPGDGIGLDALERELGLESKPSLQQALRTRWLTRTSEVASARLGELGPGERADRTQTATTLVNRALVAPGGVMGMPGRSLVPIVAMLLPGAASSSGDLTTARTTLDRAVAALDLRPSGLAGGSASSGSATPPEIHEMVPLGAGVPASTVPPPVTDEVEHFGPPLDPGAEPHFLERSHPLVNIRPLSDALVASMRDGLLEAMRTNPHPAGHVGLEAFGTRLHAILDSRLLSTAGEELRSEAGFEIPLTRVPGAGPALALRLRASDPAAVEENDAAGRLSGQAVQLQRWAFSSPEKLSSASSSDLRTGGLATSGHWDLDRYGIGRISLNGLVRVVVNQLSRIVTAGSGVSAYTILRSREPSYVFDYTMNWEFRLLETGSDHTWTRLPLREGVRGERLRVWFPRSQSTVARGEAALAPTRPDPAVRGILEHAPVVGVEDVPSAHRLVEDVLAAFPVLADLHPDSLADLKDFLSADDVKANFPHLAFGDGMPTTDLRSSTGSALGFLHFSTPLEENLQPAGPNLENGVVETYLVSVSRAQLSVTVSNAVSFALSLVLGLRNGLSPVADVRASAGASVAYRSEHTLISGGSTKLVRSLRAAGPTQRSAGTFRLQAELVRPAGAPLLPVATSRLPNASYPVNLQIPSNDALVNTAETPARHLPPELLHLRVLGLSTTTTRVTGVDGLARELETLLREQGYLPVPQEPGTHVANALEMLADNPLTRLAVHQETLDRARLANVREMNRLRGRAGLRASVDNAIAGGALFTFEKPTRSGVERISATLHTSRSYQPGGDEAGVTQGLRLPGVQTLNFVASSTPGEWQSSVTPAAATVEANVSGQSGGHLTPGANPHYTDGAVVGGGVGGSSATSYLSGSSVGTGHEYYLLSPTSQGTTQFDVPVTHTLTVTGSFGPQRDLGPAPGRMTLAVPDFRLLTQASTEPRPARPATRTVTPEDRVRLTGEGQILLPETALIEWIEGSGALQNLVRENFGTLRPPDAAVPAQVLPGAAEAVPAGDVVPAGPGAAVVRVPRTALGVIGGWFRAAWEVLAAGPATIARAIVGENLTRASSHANGVLHSALSAEHLHAHALRILRDSYVVEGVATSGIWAGQDVVLEVRGYLTGVKAQPRTPTMDGERWLQSTTGHSEGVSTSSSLQGSLRAQGQGPAGSAPGGQLVRGSGSTHAEQTVDNTSEMRVTVEDSIRMHPFNATAVFVVSIRRGTQQFATNLVGRGAEPLAELAVNLPNGVQFLLTDNDLHNHPRLANLAVAQDETLTETLTPPVADLPLPLPFRRSHGQLGFGTVTEVTLDRGRDALQNEIVAALERLAPGIVTPGTSAFMPGLLGLVNENSSSLGRRTLMNHGPQGHVQFKAVHRYWGWPRIVSIKLHLHVAPAELEAARARRVATGGVDNVISHISALGTALPGRTPGRTRITDTSFRTSQVDLQPAGNVRAAELTPTLTSASRNSVATSATSTRETRTWTRSMESMETTFAGQIRGEVTIEPAYGHALIALRRALVLLMTWGYVAVVVDVLHQALRRLAALATGAPVVTTVTAVTAAPEAATPEPIRVEARISVRFQASEADLRLGPEDTQVPAPWRLGEILTADPIPLPSVPAEPGASPADHVAVTVGTGPLDLTTADVWRPVRPVHVYDVPDIDRLGEAVRQVAPDHWRDLFPPTSKSAEGMFIRLNRLIQSGALTLLSGAATAPLVSARSAPVQIRLTLYAPVVDLTGQKIAIDDIRVDNEIRTSTAATSVSRNLTFAPSGTVNAADLGGSVPLIGSTDGGGNASAYGTQLRDVLRFGSAAGAAGAFDGHRVDVVAVFEVVGPGGTTRWVPSRMTLRTTETPPTHRAAQLPGPRLSPEGIVTARAAWRDGPARAAHDALSSLEAGTSRDELLAEATGLVGRVSLFGADLSGAPGPEAAFLRSEVVPVVAHHLRTRGAALPNGRSLHELLEEAVDDLHLQIPRIDAPALQSILSALTHGFAGRPDLLSIARHEVLRLGRRPELTAFDEAMSLALLEHLAGRPVDVPALMTRHRPGGAQKVAWLFRLHDLRTRNSDWESKIKELRLILVHCPD